MNPIMDKKILGLVAAVLVVLGAFWALKAKPVSVPPSPNPSFGGSGSVIVDNKVTVNGVTTWTLRQNMQAASTTLCYFPNPNGTATSTDGVGAPVPAVGKATSTLLSLSVQISTGTSTAATFDIATSTTPWATSTPAFMYASSVASGAQFSGMWNFGGVATSSDTRLVASLPSVAGASAQVGPAEFVVVKTAGAGLGGYTYGGQCIATFRSYSAI